MQPCRLEQSLFSWQEQAISEIVALAMQVAKHQRSEDHLQSHDMLKLKLLKEYGEFEEARRTKSRIDVLSELADITYYNACMFALDHDEHDLQAVQRYVCTLAGVTVEQSYRAALAKYRLRASAPNSKDFDVENEAIRQALDL